MNAWLEMKFYLEQAALFSFGFIALAGGCSGRSKKWLQDDRVQQESKKDKHTQAEGVAGSSCQFDVQKCPEQVATILAYQNCTCALSNKARLLCWGSCSGPFKPMKPDIVHDCIGPISTMDFYSICWRETENTITCSPLEETNNAAPSPCADGRRKQRIGAGKIKSFFRGNVERLSARRERLCSFGKGEGLRNHLKTQLDETV